MIRRATAALACFKYNRIISAVLNWTVYLMSQLGSPTQTHKQRPLIQYNSSLTASTESIPLKKHWDSREVTWANLKKQDAAALRRRKGLDVELLTLCCYAKPSLSWLETFLSSENVLLHSVTPFEYIDLYIYLYIYI